MPVKYGVMGTANIAKKVITAIGKAEGSELAAVASRSAERCEEWCKEIGLPASVKRYATYEDLLADESVQVIYIPLPTSMHAEWVPKAAQAGKHVLCEKPVGISTEEVQAMTKACKDANVQFMDGVMWMHHVRTAEMLSVIQSGVLGTVKRVNASFSFCGDEEFHNNNIRVKKGLDSLGCVGDLGWYTVRAALWAFQADPVSVSAFSHATSAEGVITSGSATLFFGDGRFACMDFGFDTNWRQMLEVAGSQNSLRCSDFVLADADEKSTYTIGTRYTTEEKQGGACNQESRMIERMSTIVASGELEDEWPLWAVRTQRVCDAIMASALSGTQERIVPV
eukprot:CAMPEP_0206223530 /NCGR_PEP_ID=MMETSP0047_2-20121206/6533_1 /ASSEMBLY_ACC=CAM_ASM_000192 /TAXON_ID=195065 /ORGANISM="Chroomonas mesostigmatica_cf, Strain CCMP1168" /LENGTH=337 /DNA_ID=CAMNT_0053646409 /DNA_START=44 /DNA_END=1057 /DNA_ORIENTATION=-